MSDTPSFRRLIVTLGHGGADPALLRNAAEFARLLGLDLHRADRLQRLEQRRVELSDDRGAIGEVLFNGIRQSQLRPRNLLFAHQRSADARTLGTFAHTRQIP